MMTFFQSRQEALSSWFRILLFFLGMFLFSLFCFVFLHGLKNISFQKWMLVWHYREVFFHGWLQTVLLSFVALNLSFLMGFVIAMARKSSWKLLRNVALLVIEGIRGTPLLTQILFFFYVVAHNIGLQNRMVAGVVILSLFSSVYIAEMIRASIEVIPQSQWESAKAIGLTVFQTYRYIIIPQAIRPLLPSLTGQFASIIKDSSLLSVLGISELTLAAQQVNATTYCTLESFLPLTLGYLILTFPISLLSRWLERYLRS